MTVSTIWERINRWGKKKAIKLEAQALWKNGMRMAPEADFLLRMAHQEGVQGRSPFTAVVLGKPNQGLHDTNHLSLFRSFGRHAYAEHWAELIKTTATPKDVLGVNRSYEELFAAWSNIEHKDFWMEAGKRLNTDPHWRNGWYFVLEHAGYNGNVQPFDVCDPAIVCVYAQKRKSFMDGTWSLSRNNGQYRMLHPDTAHWLVDKGWWQTQDLQLQVNEDTFALRGQGFMGWEQNIAMSSEYVVTTCEKVLRTCGLSNEQTVRFVGQAFMAFGPGFWDKTLEPRLRPFMVGIDMDVLRTVCGDPFYDRAPQEDKTLFDTLHRATNITAFAFNPADAAAILQEHNNAHPALMMLMDFQPPKDRVDLYRLGVAALHAQRGLVKEAEIFVLPDFEGGP